MVSPEDPDPNPWLNVKLDSNPKDPDPNPWHAEAFRTSSGRAPGNDDSSSGDQPRGGTPRP